MNYSIENKLVNWQDCMSVSADHFKQSENHFIDIIRDEAYQRIGKHGYGLLPLNNLSFEERIFDLNQLASNSSEVSLRNCQAITASGIRIDINEASQLYLTQTVTIPNKNHNENVVYDIIVAVDPYKRQPWGEPNILETPPRHPLADKTYALHVVPSGDLLSNTFNGHHLVIGRLRLKNNKFEIDPHFIPPCVSMDSHTDLIDIHNRLGQQFIGLGKDSTTIVAKIISRSSDSRLGINIKEICQSILNYVSTHYFSYRNNLQYSAPINTINLFSTLAHIIYININTLPSSEKEELLKYFYEWSDITPGSFESMLTQNMEAIYDHNNLRAAMLQIEAFVHSMSDLWKRLNQLEYIGQHKDSIVVSERKKEQQSTEVMGWSVVD